MARTKVKRWSRSDWDLYCDVAGEAPKTGLPPKTTGGSKKVRTRRRTATKKRARTKGFCTTTRAHRMKRDRKGRFVGKCKRKRR